MVQGECRKRRGSRDWGNPTTLGNLQELRNAYHVEAKGELELVSRNPVGRKRAAWVVAEIVMTAGAGCALGCFTMVIGIRDFPWAKA